MVLYVSPHLIFSPCVKQACLRNDDFSNPDSGWPSGEDSETLFGYLNGEYRILIRPEDWGLGVRSDFKPKDFTAAVDIRNANDRHGAYGLIFSLDDSWTSFDTFEIYSSGYFGVYRFDPGGYAVLAQAFSHAIKQDTATNRLSIERYGDVIKAYVNGQLLANIADGTYRRFGYVGLIVFSYDQKNVDIYFDNFNAIASDCIPNTASSVSALFADGNQISTRHPSYPLR